MPIYANAPSIVFSIQERIMCCNDVTQGKYGNFNGNSVLCQNNGINSKSNIQIYDDSTGCGIYTTKPVNAVSGPRPKDILLSTC